MPVIVVVLCCIVGTITLTAVIGLVGAIRQTSKEAGDGIVEPLHKRIWNALSLSRCKQSIWELQLVLRNYLRMLRPLTHPPGVFLYWGHIPQTLCQRRSSPSGLPWTRFEIVTKVWRIRLTDSERVRQSTEASEIVQGVIS